MATTSRPPKPQIQPEIRRRRRRRVLLAIAALGLALIPAYFGCSRYVAKAVVMAPNQGRGNPLPRDGAAAANARLPDGREYLIPVGPPPATLSVWVIEPEESRGSPGGDTANRSVGTDVGPKWSVSWGVKDAVASRPAGQPRGTILFLHGIRGQKAHMAGMGRTFAERGFRSVLVDLRGHGQSSGDYLSYGLIESRDLSQVLDALKEKGLLTGPVGVYGVSYGAATAIMLAGGDPRIEAAVAVAPFTSLHDIAPRYIRRYLTFGRLLTDGWIADAVRSGGKIAGFDSKQASPIDAIKRAKGHVLLIHGKADDHIPCTHSKRLAAAGQPGTRLVLIDDEDHNTIMRDRTGIMTKETIAWFEQWLGQAASQPATAPRTPAR